MSNRASTGNDKSDFDLAGLIIELGRMDFLEGFLLNVSEETLLRIE